ncbi:hypothetical protein MAR621_03163 [Maribacter dokdonensis]|nr:hypothetical protein MAR621_03163 [Maribacter dokdonensis]
MIPDNVKKLAFFAQKKAITPPLMHITINTKYQEYPINIKCLKDYLV